MNSKNSTSPVSQKASPPIQIDFRIQSALDFCSEEGISSFVLALPFEVPLEHLQWLRTDSRIKGVIISTLDENLARQFGDWLGAFLPSEYTWKLPLKSAQTIVYIGKRSSISFRMLKASLRQGVRNIVCKTPLFWIKVSVPNLLICRVGHYLAAKLENLKLPSPLNFPAIMGQRKLTYSRVLATNSRQSTGIKNSIKRRVVLVNSSLVAGGAERQVVNTIKGIRKHGMEPFLLCQHLFDRPDHDFYLSELQELGVPVWQIGESLNTTNHLEKLLRNASVGKALSKLPPYLADDILAFYNEFRTLQPEIVHAWQDSCCIRSGIAAILAEVPWIVLSFRNLSPRHFHYHQPYLKPAYQALADHPNVIFTNNSLAGARDYARWLGLPLSRFRIIRNGVDLSHLKNPVEPEKAQFRTKLGIPQPAPLIGSIFRFWPEKRPLLWVRMAAEVASRVPEAHFVLVGWGPLQESMEGLANQLNLKDRLHIVPPRNNVAIPLSTLDMFVLTSQFEGIPNVVLESQWLGIPVVTTNAGGASEAIDQNVTGWMVESDGAPQLAEEVVSILRDSDRLKQAKAQGPAFVKRAFSMEQMVEETMGVYGY